MEKMDFSIPGAEHIEEVAQPQGTEFMTEEVVPPHTADNNTDFAVSDRVEAENMTDEEFAEYIRGIKDGTEPRMNTAGKEHKAPESGNPEGSPEAGKPYRSFETKEEFNSFMTRTIGERLKNSREDRKRYDSLVQKAQSIYGGSEDDVIDRMFDDIERRAADEAGVSPEDYREDIAIKRDAIAFRAERERKQQHDAEIESQIKSWEEETRMLREAIPDFDFEKAMENESFRNAVLHQNMSLSAAYIYATRNSPEKQGPKRQEVYEVGNARTRISAARATNPMDMTDEEFARYIAGIKNS